MLHGISIRIASGKYSIIAAIFISPLLGICSENDARQGVSAAQEGKSEFSDFVKGMDESQAFEELNSYIGKGNVERAGVILDIFPELIRKEDKFGRTPLYMSCYAGNLECLKLLLSRGADINTPGEGGNLPLHRAAESGHLDVVKLLMDKGALRWSQNKKGESAIFKAAAYGHKDVVAYFLEKGDFVSCVDKQDNTPLHKAAQRNQFEMVKYLVEKGAVVKAKNKQGKKPSDLATKKEIVKYLNDRDPDVPESEDAGNEEK